MNERGFPGSYEPGDVTFLLKRVAVAATDLETRERLIQSGSAHYSELVPAEYPPDDEYLALYLDALNRNASRLAGDIAALAAALDSRAPCGREIVIASLARAGTPIGVLLKRALERRGRRTAHYSISIVRDRGIDLAALTHLAAYHDPADTVFVDGWTGKGAIASELRASLADRPLGFAPYLAVVADPAGCADLAATGEDYLIPSGLLNSIVSGLVSRSILNDKLVGPGDFHACVEYPEMAGHDLSRAFVDRISALAPVDFAPTIHWSDADRAAHAIASEALIASLAARYSIADRNRIKPGIAEATRVLLRRTPNRLLLHDMRDPDVAHLVYLAGRRGVAIDPLPAKSHYRAVALIRTVDIG